MHQFSLYQAYTRIFIWNVNLKMDHHTGGKWFIHGPKHFKENQMLNLELSQIILSLVCRLGIEEVHGHLSNPFSSVSGKKHPGEVDKCRNSNNYNRNCCDVKHQCANSGMTWWDQWTFDINEFTVRTVMCLKSQGSLLLGVLKSKYFLYRNLVCPWLTYS